MSKIGIASALLGLLILAGPRVAAAQTGEESAFSTNYFVNASTIGGPLGVYRIFNKNSHFGPIGGTPPPGDPTGQNVCALIYVFDPGQQIKECCSCLITPVGTAGATIAALTVNPVGGGALDTGTIKIVAAVPDRFCGAGEEAEPGATLAPGQLVSWLTHINSTTDATKANELRFLDTDEPDSDQNFLGLSCQFAHSVGGTEGQCICRSR